MRSYFSLNLPGHEFQRNTELRGTSKKMRNIYDTRAYGLHIDFSRTYSFCTQNSNTTLSRRPSVCVFMCCHLIYSIRQTCGRTSRGHTGFLHLPSPTLALFFIARRIQPFLSLVDRDVEFCVLTNQSFSTCWAFLFHFIVLFVVYM